MVDREDMLDVGTRVTCLPNVLDRSEIFWGSSSKRFGDADDLDGSIEEIRSIRRPIQGAQDEVFDWLERGAYWIAGRVPTCTGITISLPDLIMPTCIVCPGTACLSKYAESAS